MTGRPRKWRPLHVAIAWVLARDEQFCNEVEADKSSEERTFIAPSLLERTMRAVGCFLPEPQATVCVRRTWQGTVNHSTWAVHSSTCTVSLYERLVATPNYQGRFSELSRAYDETGWSDLDSAGRALYSDELLPLDIVSLDQYLLNQWFGSFESIIARIADEEIKARGTALDGDKRSNIDMPPNSVTSAMWLDVDGMVWEGPQVMWGNQQRRWLDISLNWEDVLKAFPPHEPPSAESQCLDWLKALMRKTPTKRPKPRRCFQSEAQKLFDGLTGVGFGKAWSDAIIATGAIAWKSGGRPSKKP
jgi:hypothetical protein